MGASLDLAPLLDAVPGATIEEGFGPVTVDVPVESWAAAVELARTELGCGWFDFLTAVDESEGLHVVCHVARTDPFGHLLLRTRLARDRPEVRSVAPSYAGAGWHERETAEMFGVDFTDPAGAPLPLEPLLLPPGFDGHPLRKDFALQSRLDRPWPGDKDPR
jgi:NADH:ubiquinone oxidoreductase subunit C